MVMVEKTLADCTIGRKTLDCLFHFPDLYNPIREESQITNAQPDKLEGIFASQSIVGETEFVEESENV